MDAKILTRAVPAAGAVFSLLALFTVAACGYSGGAASPDEGTTTVRYTVTGPDDGDVGPDGQKHDTFKTTDSTNIKLGQRVTLKFTNTDDMPHSFTLPDLGINVMIPGAMDGKDGVATYSFTASKAGTYRWFCAVPCDTDNNGWAMQAGSKGAAQDNFMAGYLHVS